MTALIVTESLFGNTLAIAEAIRGGIAEVHGTATVRVVHASQAPSELPDDVELLIIGAPTHLLSLPNAGSRHDAAGQGARLVQPTGVREWIEVVSLPTGLRVATFDTSIPDRVGLGTAAGAAARALRDRGIEAAVGPSFFVTGMEGPLADGELGRANSWGRALAATVAAQP